MATTTSIKSNTRFLGLPKNRTGLFAADTIHEVKSTRNNLITVPALSPQFRNNNSTNLLLASSEQNHHQLQQFRLSKNEIQQYYPLDQNQGSLLDSSNDSRLTLTGIRNGFRPSTVRHHHNLRLTSASTQRNTTLSENKDLPPKSVFIQSQASAKLRSEIDHINNKLLRHQEANKGFYFQNNQDSDNTPHSSLSYATSCRQSSASTTRTADRIHQRFTSAISNVTANTRTTIPTIHETLNQPTQILEGQAALSSSPPLLTNEVDDNQQDSTDYQPSHAYQVPQQANVGSESIFLTDPLPLASIKTRSAKPTHRHKERKSVSCPFYVMYMTNLAMQQRESKDHNPNNKENDFPPLTILSAVRKVPTNSRTSTANPKRQLTKRQVNSPISITTYSTIDDDDHKTNSTPVPTNKRLSTKTSTVENENSHMLRDILRTSSWYRVQM